MPCAVWISPARAPVVGALGDKFKLHYFTVSGIASSSRLA